MPLKMYEFEGGELVWVCAESKDRAIDIFIAYFGEEVWKKGLYQYGDKAVREMRDDEVFTYYEDGKNPDKDTIRNHITKRCDGADVFATSMY